MSSLCVPSLAISLLPHEWLLYPFRILNTRPRSQWGAHKSLCHFYQLCVTKVERPWVLSTSVTVPYRLRIIPWDWLQWLNTEEAMAERKPYTTASSSGCLLGRESWYSPHHVRTLVANSTSPWFASRNVSTLLRSRAPPPHTHTRTSDFLHNPKETY